MTTEYVVKLAGPFRTQLRIKLSWWAENRDKNPHALDRELEQFLANVVDNPWSAPNLEGCEKEFRSWPLHKTHHRIAYQILVDERVVYLLAIWNHRERPPTFRF